MLAGRIVFSIIVLSVLGGCASDMAPLAWSKPDASYKDYLQTRIECLQKAQTARSGVANQNQCANRDTYIACFKAEGWKTNPRGFIPLPGTAAPFCG